MFKLVVVAELVGLSLLFACTGNSPPANGIATSIVPSLPIAASMKPSTVATPTAKTLSPDSPVPFNPLKGFEIKRFQQIVTLDKTGQDNTVEGFKVFRTQAEFDTFLETDPYYLTQGLKPDTIDFTKSWVLVTAKVTSAYKYSGGITSLRMEKGNLIADYAYTITYSSEKMLNDYIRPVHTYTRIDQREFQELKLNVTESKAAP